MSSIFTCPKGRKRFEKAMNIIIQNPHSYDKKLIGCELSISELNPSESSTFTRTVLFKNGKEEVETITWKIIDDRVDVQFSSNGASFSVRFRRTEVQCSNCPENLVAKLKELCVTSQELKNPIPTLRLVSLRDYDRKYNELKEKYYKNVKKIWCGTMNPEKDITEDLGIASYLILLWEEERRNSDRESKQSFVDLGCGNGLLVYILTKEGYSGIGLDIRKRKMWDLFKDVDLRESTIVPSTDLRFPESDWLIGNHSDELTPWIPVISAMTSYQTKFFVLPCCAYEFTHKFCRRNINLSIYADYLNYVEEVCKMCGFEAERDRLRIPSTKRTCFVGRRKTHQEEECRRNKILNFLEGETFTPRPKFEEVKNCTQLDKNIVSTLIEIIVRRLLCLTSPEEGSLEKWNPGITLKICELANDVPRELLQKLKTEHGGLQTLLRNHHYIFHVSGGNVRLRVPGKDLPKVTPKNIKTKTCWFYANHPQGCPASDETCFWLHENETPSKKLKT